MPLGGSMEQQSDPEEALLQPDLPRRVETPVEVDEAVAQHPFEVFRPVGFPLSVGMVEAEQELPEEGEVAAFDQFGLVDEAGQPSGFVVREDDARSSSEQFALNLQGTLHLTLLVPG